MYDLIIKNGKIIDGTGTPHYSADVAVKDGKIAKIAKKLDGAAHIINAKGLTVTPGFIDSHSHSDGAILTSPDMKEKIEKGKVEYAELQQRMIEAEGKLTETEGKLTEAEGKLTEAKTVIAEKDEEILRLQALLDNRKSE